jgi:hypothetical protein
LDEDLGVLEDWRVGLWLFAFFNFRGAVNGSSPTSEAHLCVYVRGRLEDELRGD